MFREESEEHVVRRLEAFSDIVIGFSLAQLTLNLAFPNDALVLFTNPRALVAFALTFTIVAGMWWSHHRLFTHYFVPRPAYIVLNFCGLAALLLMVYSLQVWLHAKINQYAAYAMYTAAVAVVILINAFLTNRGVAIRGDRMGEELARRGLIRSRGMAILGVVFGIIAISAAETHSMNGFGNLVLVAVLFVFIVLRAINRRGQARSHFPPGVKQ